MVRKIKEKIKKHPWDETMVIIVMVGAALSILILLAGYMKVVGEAYAGLPTEEGVLEKLNKCEMVSGEEKTRCTITCRRRGETCILAWGGEELKRCREVVRDYSCLCCS